MIADEIAEFSHNVLENLRQPLESHVVSLSYLGESYQFPADFMLIATMNLCPCGQFPNMELCTCLPSAVRRYQSRLSFPLLERIEMGLTLEPVPEEEQTCCTEEEALQIRDAIHQAAQRQRIRYAEETFSWNSRIPPSLLETYCPLEKDAKALLEAAASRFGFSLRTQHNCIKTARSIADLAGSELILREHMAEALLYRPRGFVTP